MCNCVLCCFVQISVDRWTEAVEVYKTALVDPGDQIDVLLNLAEVLAIDLGELEEAVFVLQKLRSAMLLRKEVARISSLHKHEVEFSTEGLVILRVLHFSLATQFAARQQMEESLKHFGKSCDPATCPFGERSLSPALVAYYEDADGTCAAADEDEPSTNNENGNAISRSELDELLAAVESSKYKDVIKQNIHTRRGTKIAAILEAHARREKMRNQPSAAPSAAPSVAADSEGGRDGGVNGGEGKRERGRVQLAEGTNTGGIGSDGQDGGEHVRRTKWVRRLKEGVSEYNGVYRRYPVENEFHVGIIATDEDLLAEVAAGREGVDGREGLAGWAGERSEGQRKAKKKKSKRGKKKRREGGGGIGSGSLLVGTGVAVSSAHSLHHLSRSHASISHFPYIHR
jgi:hypothetical protein